MLLFVVAACMIPLLIQGRLIAQSSRQMQVERRIIDVQNQCQILSNKMSRNGYLGNSGVDTSGTDTELSMLADIFNGRILIVNSGFRIVKDTFSLAEGKICISDETLRCFQGETTSRYDTEKHYFILAVPIADTVQTADARKSPKTAGVMLVTVPSALAEPSVYSVNSSDKTSYQIIIHCSRYFYLCKITGHQFFHSGFGLIQLFLCQLAHLFIRFFFQHHQAVFYILLTLFILIICLYDRSKITLFFHQLAETLRIICNTGRPLICHTDHSYNP